MTDAEPQREPQPDDDGAERAPVVVEPAPATPPDAAPGAPDPDAQLPGAATPVEPVSPEPAPEGDQTAMSPPPARTPGWTPEQLIQAFKEIVTAILAILLVAYTVSLARSTFSFIGDPDKISDAKDVLLLMLGLAGVVVGYYFGRVPADAQATQAQKQAAAATAQTEQVSAQAQQVAEEASEVASRLATSSATRSGADPDLAADLEKLQRGLRDLRRMAQQR